MEDFQRYSPSYRADETRQVMDWIRAGQCGCIVGLRGSGKSNFIRFLLRADTQQQHLGSGQSNFVFAPVNLLFLIERNEWGVYEMILKNLFAQLHSANITDEIIQEIKVLHQEIMRTRDSLIAERAVEQCMDLLCQQASQQVILLFDEFDAVFRDLPASLFRCLRAIRDTHKDQVSYIVVATHDLPDLRNDLEDETDHFYRLVRRNPCWLGPYLETDAMQMIDHLSFRRNHELAQKDAFHLFKLSGGHASLLKAILSLLLNGLDPRWLAQDASVLVKEPTIQRECRKIWDSLSEDEKTAMCSFFNNDPLDERMLNHLTARGLLRQNGPTKREVFSPLLNAFIQEQAPPPQTGFYLKRSPQIVQINGQPINGLTKQEFKFLAHLYDHPEKVCTKKELVEKVYNEHYNPGYDQMLQALVKRLRKKIEPNSEHHHYITTVRGVGYKFTLPGE